MPVSQHQGQEMVATPILAAREVNKQYGNTKVLDHLSMEVPRGSIYGLLGPNGAGKTTFIRIANQITAPDSGEMLFQGRRLQRNDIAQIGYLPEERGLYRKMKVGEQALYLARLKGLSKADAWRRISWWFDRFETGSWWNKKVEELSKGMQQKLQFIITVLHEPSLLILDEPFSGFDPVNAELLKSEIMRLRDNGATVMLSTHNMASVEEMCDHISLINKSKCILQGNVAQIRREYKSGEYEIGFTGDETALTEALNTHGCTVSNSGLPGKIKIHAPEKSGNQLLELAIACVKVQSFNEILPSMNDIFIRQVTQK
ncbi:MAG: ATP-binding cassette domain-containing protein [Bacteroidales bacterium]|jgi:ABC-2 type transport system ATP-binding protein|nr:ATP-binding cassette domain-containing protein [Bacteroidales bacterium]